MGEREADPLPQVPHPAAPPGSERVLVPGVRSDGTVPVYGDPDVGGSTVSGTLEGDFGPDLAHERSVLDQASDLVDVGRRAPVDRPRSDS